MVRHDSLVKNVRTDHFQNLLDLEKDPLRESDLGFDFPYDLIIFDS